MNLLDYERIEKLVERAKTDSDSKEELINQFKPFILKLVGNTHIHGYDFSDIKHECYSTLLKCIDRYDLNSKKFIGYALTSIRNTVKDLLKRSTRRSSCEGNEALILNDCLEFVLKSETDLEEMVIKNCENEILVQAICSLSEDEQHLIYYLYFEKHTLVSYSKLKNICYSTATNRRNAVLLKLQKYIKKVPA